MMSMSNMKHDAIVSQGIEIRERVEIPRKSSEKPPLSFSLTMLAAEMIPEDSRVEIDAKIHAGYFTSGKVMTVEELSAVQGRAWEDIEH